jgi:hypothetical protein
MNGPIETHYAGINGSGTSVCPPGFPVRELKHEETTFG